MTSTPPPQSLRIYLLSNPRTGSNLFTRLFNWHPDIEQILYHFMLPVSFGPERVPGGLLERIEGVGEKMVKHCEGMTIEKTKLEMEKKVENVENDGKVPLVKDHAFYMLRKEVIMAELTKVAMPDTGEHHPHSLPPSLPPQSSQTNPTIYSDGYLDTFTPIFIIRHPARMVESIYRTFISNFKGVVNEPSWLVMTSYSWSRILFEWYRSRPHATVIVIDGDDVINYPESITGQFCKLVGLDPAGVRYNWELGLPNSFEGAPDIWKPIQGLAMGSLINSTGIKKDPKLLVDPNLDDEAKRWKAAYGEEVSEAMVATVKRAMPDYEYLKQFKLKPHVESHVTNLHDA